MENGKWKMENGKLRCAFGAEFYFPSCPFCSFSQFSIPFLLFYRPHPPSALLGEAAERNFDHPSLTSPVVGEEKSFSPKLGEMVRSTREVCLTLDVRR